MHGLWPNTCSNGQGPSNGCDADRQYTDIAGTLTDAGMIDEMNSLWPSYKGDNNAFWEHEWGKHGTCVSTLSPGCFDNYEPRQEVPKYFRMALDLHKQYNLYAAIIAAKIKPTTNKNSGVPISAYVAAVRNAYGVDAQFTCKGSVITDVNLYFNVIGSVNYVPFNSPLSSGSCRGNIILPPKQVQGNVLLGWQREFNYEWTKGVEEAASVPSEV